MTFRERVLSRIVRHLGDPAPSLRIVFWDGAAVSFVPAPSVTITLRSRRLGRMLLAGNIDGLADAYVCGDLSVDGRLNDVLHVGIGIAERLGRSGLVRTVAKLLRGRPRRHAKRRDAAAIAHHYDVSNDFYALWLDQRMIYSCAYFRTGKEDLDAAQTQKLAHICRKLRLQPGESLLDIGCGWGGLPIWAAQNHDVKCVGVTLSRQQYELANQHVRAAGLEDHVEIRLQDYRDIPETGSFDKVVSVGMYEHVGIANLPLYFATIARLLKPGGAALNHGITASDRDSHPRGPPGGGFIDRYVFPGGELPHISRVLYEVAGAGLEIVDVEDLRPHYPPTLLHWVRRLEANRERAVGAAGERHYRIWRMYMAGMAYAFDRGLLGVAQVLACKPSRDGMARRPWTRAYQYGADGPVPLAGGLDWDAI